MKRLLLTGARGFVAGSVLRQADAQWTVHALSRGDGFVTSRVHWHHFDPRGARELSDLFRTVRPEVVVHTVAVADIDYCETHREEARQVNVELTRALAELCAVHGAKLVFCSTDTIFDGEHAPYREGDTAGPVNFYARTKVEAEQIVAQSGAPAVIARLALVVGLPVFGAGNSFLAKMVAALRAGRAVPMPTNEIRTPIDVLTLGRALLELADGPHTGTFHLAGNESLSRFEMGRRIATRFDLPTQLVVATDPARMPGRARRARDVSLDNAKARVQLSTPMLNLDPALDLVLKCAGDARS
ncbi:MAG: SDR family oxidoreductase [Verrucomicrobia bacterium]|nr:SDR family oxidoreductase [Verrucomicrobiota bacterium]